MNLSKVLTLASLAGACSGCYVWTYEPAPVANVVATRPGRIWIPVSADSAIIVMAPRLAGDTLLGLIEGSARPGYPLQSFAEPVDSIPRVATLHPDPAYGLRNGIRLTGIILTLFAGAYILGPTR